MYTPQGRRGSPQRSRQAFRTPTSREKGKGSPTSMGGMTIASATTAMGTKEEDLALIDSLLGTPEMNGREDATQAESETWKRLQNEGALDMPSLERKDRAALHARIADLHSRIAGLEAEVRHPRWC